MVLTGVVAALLWFVCVLLIAGALLAVVRAVLALPVFSGLEPFAHLIYTLVVLLIVIVVVDAFYGSNAFGVPHPLRWGSR